MPIAICSGIVIFVSILSLQIIINETALLFSHDSHL